MAQSAIRRGAQATSLLALRCPNQRGKRPTDDRQTFEVGIRSHTIAADIMGPVTRAKATGAKYVLSLTDYFTKYVVTVPLVQTEAKDVAKAIVENWILQFGVPDVLHTDQGKNFGSELVVRCASC